jgi:uncharacterized protein
MPLYVVIGVDKLPDSHCRRSALLPQHRAYLEANDDRIALVGPMRDASGRSCGSVYIFEAQSPEEIDEWLRHEPFVQAGVYDNLLIRRFDPVMSRLPMRDWSRDRRSGK